MYGIWKDKIVMSQVITVCKEISNRSYEWLKEVKFFDFRGSYFIRGRIQVIAIHGIPS